MKIRNLLKNIIISSVAPKISPLTRLVKNVIAIKISIRYVCGKLILHLFFIVIPRPIINAGITIISATGAP